MPLHQWHNSVLYAAEDRGIALLLARVHLQGDQLGPPGLVIEVRKDSPVFTVDRVESREDLLGGGREEDLASDQVCHLHRDEDLAG